MLLKKLALLCLIGLITACEFAPDLEKGIEYVHTAYDVYELFKPVGEAIIAPELTKLAPTPFPEQKLVDYFELAGSSDCRKTNDSILYTVVTILCTQKDATVRFDQWMALTDLDELVSKVRSSPGVQVTNDGHDTWVDPANPEVPLGKLLEFKTEDGKAHIFWTVYGKNFSGWIDGSDGNQQALHRWWETKGGRHH